MDRVDPLRFPTPMQDAARERFEARVDEAASRRRLHSQVRVATIRRVLGIEDTGFELEEALYRFALEIERLRARVAALEAKAGDHGD